MFASRTVSTLTCIALLAPLVSAQQRGSRVVNGKGNLRGVTAVYLDAKGDEPLRAMVSDELRKQLPELVLVAPGTPGALVVEIARAFVERKEAMTTAPGLGEPTRPVTDRFQLRPRGPIEDPRASSLERLKERQRVDRECWVFASVLRPTTDESYAEVLRYRHLVSRGIEARTRDFVEKLAKEYRKANGEKR